MPDMAKKITPGFQALLVIISILTALYQLATCRCNYSIYLIVRWLRF